MQTPVDFKLYLITDRLNLPDGQDLFAQVEAALRGGVQCVQLREKDLPAAALLPLAQRMRELTREYGAQLLINREIEVALAVNADGLHLGGDSLSIKAARRRLGPDKLIGVSTHRLKEVCQAVKDGADFVTFGPVYATPSKLKYGEPVGVEALAQAIVAAGDTSPVFALGGVNLKRLPKLLDLGCRQVACIGAILFAEDPEAQARKMVRMLS